jgi:polysaccharide pyruvyl transferase WcaK-like protein
MNNYDIYLSSGGDNFAENPDGCLYNHLLDLMNIGERAKDLGAAYSLWGSSVGPFQDKNLSIVKHNLLKADAIFAREEITFDYLNTIGLPADKIHLVADPAFWMVPDYTPLPIEKKPGELLIGLNISPLSVHVSFSNYEAGTKIVFESLDTLLDKNHYYRFLCIPHVMSGHGNSQDDFSFMRTYRDYSKYKNRVDVVDFGLGAKKTKSIVSQCDLLIAARMHCCVAGLSSATPTLLLTYSQKGMGMAKYAYGDLDLALPVNAITAQSLYQNIKSVEGKLDFYKAHLTAQQGRFKDDAAKAIINLKNLYSLL